MGDSGDCPASPPLARGAYNINFDEFDDTIDPFKPRGGLSNSPGTEMSNPFESKSKMASSPPKQAVQKPVVENHEAEIELPVKEENGFVGEESPTNSNMTSSPPIDIQKPVKGKKKKVKKQKNENSVSPSGNKDINEEDPFKTKLKLGQSPHEEDDPFQSNAKLKSSPQNDNGYLVTDNPFQTNCKMGVSPPGGNNYIQDAPVNSDNRTADDDIQNESVESFETAEESPDKSNKGFKTRSKSRTPPAMKPVEDSVQEEVDQDGGSESVQPDGGSEPVQLDGGSEPVKTDGGSEPVQADGDSEPVQPKSAKPEKKAASPKKSGIKKPKARSKFKPPANFGVQDSEDVVIFAPPSPNSANNDTASDIPAETDEPTGNQTVNKNSNSGTNQMTTSEVLGGVSDMIDSVHDFGACEMPMESNEDFVPASEAFNEDEAWDMMEKMKNENGAPVRKSLSAFDPLSEEQVPDKVTRSSSDVEVDGNSHLEDEDLLLMNTPPQQKQHSGSSRGVSRHPAARALQEHVDGDGAPREAHVVDKMLFSPVRGEERKPRVEGGERYFDAPEYPLAAHKSQSENEVERMNAENKKHAMGKDINQDNIVQLVQVLKYSQSDWNKLKQDLELDFNARILNKEREWSKKLADRDKKIAYLEEQVLLLRSSNDDMKCVVTEFEKTIAQLQAEKMKSTTESQQGYEDIVKERDQALEDLQSVETAFSDLHQRYERTKGVVEGFKKNEDVLKKCVQDYQNKLKASEDKTVSVRHQAEEKLAIASDEMDKLRKTTTSEVARLEAALKKAELKIQGLDRSLEQKMQENSELTAICDELIAKVSTD